jgi:hypothetical protein
MCRSMGTLVLLLFEIVVKAQWNQEMLFASVL